MKSRTAAVLENFSKLSPAFRVRTVLAVLAAAIALFLLIAKKPWELGDIKPTKVSHFVTIYFWAALAVDLVLVALLAATAGWWTKSPANSESENRKSRLSTPRWFWPLVGAAMILNAILCWPRLSHSFWHDETYPIRNAIVGVYRQQPDGSVKLRPVSWQDTFFFYKKPNHTLYSGIARLCNETWRAIAKPKGLQFNEVVIRLPAYLAGIASVATIALLLEELEFFSAGVLAAFLTVLHPWHIRYASEARAYAFVLFLLPLVVYCLLRAINGKRWQWWVAFGISQFFLLYFYPTCVYVLVVLNLCAPLAIWWTWGRNSATPLMHWLVVNIGAAMLFLPLMLPCVPQFLEYVKGTSGQGELSLNWLANFSAHMIAGIPWAYQGHYEPGSIELYPWFVHHPGLGVLITCLAAVFLTLGIRRLFAKSRIAALIPVILLLPAVICYADTARRNGFIYEWYLIFLLPGAVAMVALGMDEIWTAAGRSYPGRFAAGALLAGLIAGYVVWTTPQRDFLLAHSIQPNRESVLLTRPTLDPKDSRQKDILTATFYGAPEPYDPHILMIRSGAELGNLVHRADAEGKTLFINLGYLTTVEGEHAHKYDLLKKSGLFEEVELISGFEPTMHSRHIFRYKAGTGASYDFAALPADRGRPGTGYSY